MTDQDQIKKVLGIISDRDGHYDVDGVSISHTDSQIDVVVSSDSSKKFALNNDLGTAEEIEKKADKNSLVQKDKVPGQAYEDGKPAPDHDPLHSATNHQNFIDYMGPENLTPGG